MKRVALLTVVAGFLLLSGGARAEEDEATQRARELFKKAEVHFSVGEFEKALSLYKEAFKTKPLPAFLFNIGQCHRNLGHCDRALFFFKQYLVRTPDPPNRADVEKLIKICEEQVAKKEAASRPTQPEKVPETKEEAPRAKGEDRQSPVEPAPQPPGRRRLSSAWFWSAAGVAGALLVAGTVTGVMALNKSDEYKDPATKLERRLDLKDSGESLRSVSTATYIAGAVAAAGAGVLFFFTDWVGERETTVSAGPLPGGATLLLGGRF